MRKPIQKTRDFNYYGLENGYCLCIEEDYVTRKFYAWIQKTGKPKLLIFEVDMTYSIVTDPLKQGNEYLLIVDITEQLLENYIKIYKETYKDVQLPEDQKR